MMAFWEILSIFLTSRGGYGDESRSLASALFSLASSGMAVDGSSVDDLGWRGKEKAGGRAGDLDLVICFV